MWAFSFYGLIAIVCGNQRQNAKKNHKKMPRGVFPPVKGRSMCVLFACRSEQRAVIYEPRRIERKTLDTLYKNCGNNGAMKASQLYVKCMTH